MTPMYLTPTGELVETVTQVYLSKDKTYYSPIARNTSYYDEHGIKDITYKLPKSLEVEHCTMKNGEIDISNNTIHFDFVSPYIYEDDIVIEFKINKDLSLSYYQSYCWCRCSETFEGVKLLESYNDFDFLKLVKV